MSLVVIPNQAINLEPYTPDPCNLGDRKEYCALVANEDPVYLQWQQTPCGDDLALDGSFEEDYFPNPYWTAGDGWLVGVGSACHSPGVAGVLSQEGLHDPGDDSGFYKVTLTVTGMTAGTLEVNFDSDDEEVITQNGIYNFYFEVSAVAAPVVFNLSADADFDGCE